MGSEHSCFSPLLIINTVNLQESMDNSPSVKDPLDITHPNYVVKPIPTLIIYTSISIYGGHLLTFA